MTYPLKTLLCTGCICLVVCCTAPDGKNSSAGINADSTGQAKDSLATTATSSKAAVVEVNTDDPAVAVIETGDARFKLHGLLEFRPQAQAGLPVDPEKKYIMADISVENIGTAPIYPAGYMLTAQLIDQKGRKHSFVSSVKTVALFDGHPSNKYGSEQSAGFTSESFAPGAKARGFLYGFEVDKDVVFTKMSMQVNDNIITAALNQ